MRVKINIVNLYFNYYYNMKFDKIICLLKILNKTFHFIK